MMKFVKPEHEIWRLVQMLENHVEESNFIQGGAMYRGIKQKNFGTVELGA